MSFFALASCVAPFATKNSYNATGCKPKLRGLWICRRSAVEPVIGHAKGEHRMGRNYLAGPAGDAINAVLAAAGYNFRRLLAWLAILLLAFLAANARQPNSDNQPVVA